jgi:transposase
MEVKDHLPLAELERLERDETSAQRGKRLRIVILAVQGFTAPAVAMCVGLSRRICQRWVRRYNEEGLAGLNDLRGQQAAPVLTAEQEAQMRQRLEAGPRLEDRVCSLRGVDVQRILAALGGPTQAAPIEATPIEATGGAA